MPDALRVLVVTSALVPDQLHTWRAAAQLDGIDLHVAGSLRVDSSESYPGALGIPAWGTVHVLEAAGLPRRGRLWWQLRGLEALVAWLQPDVVHVHSEAWGRLVGQALRTGARTVAHGAENQSTDHGGCAEAVIRRRVTEHHARRLAGYASWNHAGIDIMRRCGLGPRSPTAVAPAIAPEPAPFLAVDLRERGTTAVIGYVGRLVPEKGVQWLIGSVAGMDRAQLRVIGDGPYEGELRRQAMRLGVRAEWTGALGAGEMPAAIAGLDVLVVPSLTSPGWSEQFGRVVCEAMFSGVPVIASDSGALPEVVGDGGLIVSELDHHQLRGALDALLEDDETRRVLGARGRSWAMAELSPHAAADRLDTLWHEVAAA